jgi:hypothetical protein
VRRAILQVADTGPLESLVHMLRAVGYECCLPSDRLKNDLRRMGCDTVLNVSDLVHGMGYDEPHKLPIAGITDMDKVDLYVDVKAHRNGLIIWKRWPELQSKTLWYRINGGEPEHVPGCGDEVNPPCPVLTPNQWYGNGWVGKRGEEYLQKQPCRSYACWPPFIRAADYRQSRIAPYEAPICLIHNVEGWGYQALINRMRQMGVKCYGRGSPDGLIPHRKVPEMLRKAKCMVHLKSNDAPGYALYEALAASCPVVCTRRLIWRCRMEELFKPYETCLVFDRETHAPLSPQDIDSCTREVSKHLDALSNPTYNAAIGEAGRKRLDEIMWTDVAGFAKFMEANFK